MTPRWLEKQPLEVRFRFESDFPAMPRAVLDWPTIQPDFVFMCLLRALESLGNPSAGLLGVSVLFSPGQIAVPLVLSRPSVSTFGEGGGAKSSVADGCGPVNSDRAESLEADRPR